MASVGQNESEHTVANPASPVLLASGVSTVLALSVQNPEHMSECWRMTSLCTETMLLAEANITAHQPEHMCHVLSAALKHATVVGSPACVV